MQENITETNELTVLVVEPLKRPYVKTIPHRLEALQEMVGGLIECVYPFDDPVAVICNEEGKLLDLAPNRALWDEGGHMYDIIVGTFLVVGLGEEDFASLSPGLAQKYTARFHMLELYPRP